MVCPCQAGADWFWSLLCVCVNNRIVEWSIIHKSTFKSAHLMRGKHSSVDSCARLTPCQNITWECVMHHCASTGCDPINQGSLIEQNSRPRSEWPRGRVLAYFSCSKEPRACVTSFHAPSCLCTPYHVSWRTSCVQEYPHTIPANKITACILHAEGSTPSLPCLETSLIVVS